MTMSGSPPPIPPPESAKWKSYLQISPYRRSLAVGPKNCGDSILLAELTEKGVSKALLY